MRVAGVVVLCAGLLAGCGGVGESAPSSREVAPAPRAAMGIFTPEEIEIINTFSPLPPPPPDPTNRVCDDPAAARLGQFIFFDKRFSGSGRVSCASCHEPERDWTDGIDVPHGFSPDLRHVPSLWNVAYNRWYFWDGRADSLWSQALDPLEHPNEHGGSRWQYARLIHDDAELRRAYEAIFGAMPDMSDRSRFPSKAPATPGAPADAEAVNVVFANIGKALAAYQRKLVSRRAPFDVFVEGLNDGDPKKLAALSESAQRGLKLFIGRGNCRSCHHGPNFTDGEFHNTGIAAFDPERQDLGRFQGINRLLNSPFNALGPYCDDPTAREHHPTSFLVNQVERRGEFKTPSLRNVAETSPYMHRGQIETLREVVEFYSTLTLPGADMSPQAVAAREAAARRAGAGHTHGGGAEHVLTPLHLSKGEIDDLVAFLRSLTDTSIDPALKEPPASP